MYKLLRYPAQAGAIFLLCFGFLQAGDAASQTIAQKQLALAVDYAQFRGPGESNKLEVYQSIGRQTLAYRKSAGQFVAAFSLETRVTLQDSIISRGKIEEADTVNSLKEITAGQQFVYAVPLYLPAGEYKISTTLRDLFAKQQTHKAVTVRIVPFSRDILALSDIQFATQIKKAGDRPTPFDKNNLCVMPNAQAVYGDGLETFGLYAELYNLDTAAQTPGHYRVDYLIEDARGKLIYKIPGKTRRKDNPSAAIYISFDISSLPSGRYQLELVAIDEDAQSRATAAKKFNVFRRRDVRDFYEQQEQRMYASLDEAAVNHYFDQIAYIATEEEKQLFHQLNPQGKRKFLARFWKRRDPTPDTPKNEFKEDYIERLLKTKVLYAQGNTEGWKTDRGRILLQYGAPDFIDREPASSNRNASEIWYFDRLPGTDGKTMFVFVELRGTNKYQLIHSTHRGEVSNPNWEAYLYR